MGNSVVMRARSAYLLMLLGAFAFAAMVALSHVAGERCDWQYVAFARALVSFLLAVGFARATGTRLVLSGPAPLWVRSIAGSLGVVTAFYAYTHLPVSDGVTLNTTSAIWVTLLGWVVFGQRASAGTWLAVGAGVVGVALVQQPHFAGGRALAALAGLASAVCAAVSMLGLNRLQDVDARAVVAHFSGVSSVVMLVVLLASDAASRPGPLTDPLTLGLLVGVGAAGAAGQYAMTLAFARGNASRVSVVGLSQIVMSAGLDALVWRHVPNALSLAGMALVAAPTAWLLLHRTDRADAPQDQSFEQTLNPI